MRTKWRDAPLTHKIISLISIFVSLAVVVLAVLQMFDVWEYAIDICIPLMGTVNLCQAYIQWNTSRKTAYFSLGTALFIWICAVIVFCVK